MRKICEILACRASYVLTGSEIVFFFQIDKYVSGDGCIFRTTRIYNSHEKVDARYRRRAIWLFALIFGKFVTAEQQLVDMLWNSGCHVYYLIILISMLRYYAYLLYTNSYCRVNLGCAVLAPRPNPNAGDLTAKVTDPRVPAVGSGILHCCLSLACPIINCEFWRTLIFDIITCVSKPI